MLPKGITYYLTTSAFAFFEIVTTSCQCPSSATCNLVTLSEFSLFTFAPARSFPAKEFDGISIRSQNG